MTWCLKTMLEQAIYCTAVPRSPDEMLLVLTENKLISYSLLKSLICHTNLDFQMQLCCTGSYTVASLRCAVIRINVSAWREISWLGCDKLCELGFCANLFSCYSQILNNGYQSEWGKQLFQLGSHVCFGWLMIFLFFVFFTKPLSDI